MKITAFQTNVIVDSNYDQQIKRKAPASHHIEQLLREEGRKIELKLSCAPEP